MLIAQGPLRVSLFGGGSDLPSFLERHEGAVLSFAINKRVFLVGHPFTHRKGIQLKYSQTEDVMKPGDLRHPIARVILERYDVNNIDIAVMADVPAGTGMGSSSSFTVAFLAFVRHLRELPTSAFDLATEACEIEIEVLGEPIGYQDQWASALGGINLIRFGQTGVHSESVNVPASTIQSLESNLHLVPVGKPRQTREYLSTQTALLTDGSRSDDLTQQMVSYVHEGRRAILENIDNLGPLLHEAWMLKRQVAPGISNEDVDSLYASGLAAGATGGKLLGAGGSGYFVFYVPSKANEHFKILHPNRLHFKVSHEGAGVIHES